MNRHLIVISVDAMVFEDLALLGSMPNVRALLDNGSLVKRVKTIYPSLTHPVHATLMTGCAPELTGIVNNERFVPGDLNPKWFNRLDEVKCDTLFHAAHRAGLNTCACRWPVTGGGFDVIDELIPEIMGSDEQAEPDMEKLYRKAVSPSIFNGIVKPNLFRLRGGHEHPYTENFSIACACDIIRRRKPNLLMTHPCVVDSARHGNGLFNEKVNDALRLIDAWIGMLIQAVRDAGIDGETSFAVLSDHGHLEIQRELALNAVLRDRGLIQTDADGRFADWKAYAKSCDLSAQIYVKDHRCEEEVYKTLLDMRAEGDCGISEILTVDRAKSLYGLAGGFSFIVESAAGTCFIDDWRRPIVRPLRVSEHHGYSTHGHMPEKGPQPPLIVSGPAFAKGVELENASILDEGPTFAAALGLRLPEAQGMPLESLLNVLS